MALVMDLLAALLSGGLTTREIGMQGGDEYGLSQVLSRSTSRGRREPRRRTPSSRR